DPVRLSAPIMGRLHCGGKYWEGYTDSTLLSAPIMGRLHCGQVQPLAGRGSASSSPPRSWGGSIAAAPKGCDPRPQPSLSAPIMGRLHCGRVPVDPIPPLVDRPLRPDHGAAPLRRLGVVLAAIGWSTLRPDHGAAPLRLPRRARGPGLAPSPPRSWGGSIAA